MLQKIKALRTNENILIAADALLNSKSSFMNVFLMAFMIKVSLSSSATSFVVYCIVRYVLMAVFALVLLPFFRKHTLAAWRMSMIFSVFEMLAVVFLDSTAPYFAYVLAFCSSMEASLYWRPKMYFDVTEVSDSRRLRFKARTTMLTQIVKVVMPVVLGFTIGSAGYSRAALMILGISLMQLLLSLCFRPTTRRKKSSHHSLHEVYAKIISHQSLRNIIILQLIRGFVTCSSAFVVISEINLYRSVNSDLDLGIFTSVAAVVTIIAVILFNKIKNKKNQKAFLSTFLPAFSLFPIALIVIPHNMILSIAFYIFVQGIVGGLFDGTVTQARIQGILSTHLDDDSYRIEVECFGEVALTIGRVVSLVSLLALLVLGMEEYILWLALLESVLILPWIRLAIPKKHRYN